MTELIEAKDSESSAKLEAPANPSDNIAGDGRSKGSAAAGVMGAFALLFSLAAAGFVGWDWWQRAVQVLGQRYV